MNPETSTPTTATSGLATAPAPVELRSYRGSVYAIVGREVCGSAADGNCNCYPSGRGIDWKLMMTEGDTK